MGAPIGLFKKGLQAGQQKVGETVQKGFAVGQLIAGNIQRKKADALLPSSENIMERQMLNSMRRRRRGLETGTAGSADRAAIRQMGKSALSNSFKAGGKVGMGAVAAMQSQAMQNLASTYGQQTNQMFQMEQQQVKSMADLANDLARLRSTRMSARAEKNVKAGTENIVALVGKNKGGDGAGAAQSLLKKKTTTPPKDDEPKPGSVYGEKNFND